MTFITEKLGTDDDEEGDEEGGEKVKGTREGEGELKVEEATGGNGARVHDDDIHLNSHTNICSSSPLIALTHAAD